MLSIKVFELAVICIGEFIVGKHGSIKCLHNQMYFYQYCMQLRRFILKSPIRITSFFLKKVFPGMVLRSICELFHRDIWVNLITHIMFM